MSASLPRLNHTHADWSRLIGRSASPHSSIVHLGVGQFHRAHAAVYTALSADSPDEAWGILPVANRSSHVIDALHDQESCYSIVQLEGQEREIQMVDIHRGGIVASDNPMAVIDAISDPSHRIVTLTITEKGYGINPATSRLDIDNEAILSARQSPEQARTLLPQLGWGLIERARRNGADLTVLSCDNMQSNGHTTRQALLDFIESCQVESSVLDYVSAHVTFPNSMVDRIVPGTDDALRQQVADSMGYYDAIPVPAEAFSMWVMEDHFATSRPAWEKAGAIFSDEVDRYELVKLRLLNGSHSLISYLGALSGSPTIPQARGRDEIAEAILTAMYCEYLPSITLPTGFDVDDYISQLMTRWNNHALGDLCSRVGSDGSAKLPQRICTPALLMNERGMMPHMMALTAASWIVCNLPSDIYDAGPIAHAMDEPKRCSIHSIAHRTGGDLNALTHAIMRSDFGDEIAEFDGFIRRVADLVTTIVRDGYQRGIRDAVDAALSERH